MSDEELVGYDHSDAPIEWDGPVPSDEIVAKVRDSIRTELVDLARPEDLIFHTVFLDDGDFLGPTVAVYGGDPGHGFTASYSQKWSE